MAEVFPHAKFVLVSRPWDSFVERGIHKWTHDGSNTRLSAARPRVGFHWHLVNLIARYDLETYAPGRYAEIWLDVLHQGAQPAQKAFQELLGAISLAHFEFDLEVLKPQWSRRGRGRTEADKTDFGLIKQIVAFERGILTDLEAKSQGRS